MEGKSGDRGGERRRRGSKSSLFQRLRSMQEGRSMQEEKVDQRQEEGDKVVFLKFKILT